MDLVWKYNHDYLALVHSEIQRCEVSELFNSLPKYKYYSCNIEKITTKDDDGIRKSEVENFDMTVAQMCLLQFIYEDDKIQLVTYLGRPINESLSEPLDQSIISNLLQLCCMFDSVECASALFGGELGTVPLVNEMNESGKSALHRASESHAKRCVELLLIKRARTDLRTKDGRAQLALELSLSSLRDVNWNPDSHSVEDLIVRVSDKDLTTVRLLCEKTKEVAEVACTKAVEGEIVPLAALLIVDAEKINESILEFRGSNDSGSKKMMTIYECVVREALSLGCATTPSRAAKSSYSSDCERADKRKLLLSEIELLQLFSGAFGHCTERKVTSPLMRAAQAGDHAIIELLLKTNVDISEVDAEGNSALHWSLKTSRGSNSCENKIRLLWLLLRNGARVSQKNKLGLTAVHIAASVGKSEALQVLLLEDPDGVNYKTEMKETPLFFAVKNEQLDCAELLLRWGANSQVLNLRRQRPIDLATSQDMRFMLNPTNIALLNRNFPVQHNVLASLHIDEVFLDSYKALLTMTDGYTSFNSMKTEFCKFLSSPHGCVRGAKWFYANNEERQETQGTNHNSSFAAKDLKRKIFVGGLPSSLDSGSLAKFFENHFGLVEDAKVIVAKAGDQTQSRGFGFVTFKDERSVSSAVQAHFFTIMDKQVEIKSVVPKCHFMTEDYTVSAQENKPEESCQPQRVQVTFEKIKKIGSVKQMSWDDKILQGKTKTCIKKSQEHIKPAYEDPSMPIWLKIFKKWLPSFLLYLLKNPRDGEYALSSLKGDFRAKFCLEVDHASIGYSKLSDFIKCFPDLCYTKVVPTGTRGPANHMVLMPNPRLLTIIKTYSASIATSIDDGSTNSKCFKKTKCERGVSSCISLEEGKSDKRCPDENLPIKYMLPFRKQRFLKYLDGPLKPHLQKEYSACSWHTKDEKEGLSLKGVNGNDHRDQQHLALEALARKRNNPSVYFLREFDFYKSYVANLEVGKCFSCNQRMMLWANHPCKHLLWCTDCKAQVEGPAHRCVVCDMKVEKIDLVTWEENCESVHRAEEFPPFDPNNYTRSPSKKRNDSAVLASN